MVKLNGLLFVVDLIIGLYLLNVGFNFVNLAFLDSMKNVLVAIGGGLLIIGGLMTIARRNNNYR